MSLTDHLKAVELPARILTFDIETQRGIWESFSPKVDFLQAARCIVEPRILCVAARWHGTDKTIFKAAWNDDDAEAHEKMLRVIWGLLDEADFVITWNGDRFDFQWVEERCGRLGMGRPKPYKSVDLIKIAKRKFGAGLTYKSLDWSARQWLHDSKTPHGGTDLWHVIRYGTREQKREAQRIMREYCCHDTELTEQMFEKYLPWTNVNVALYRKDADSELLYCTKCGAGGTLKHADIYYTNAFGYQQYRCDKCGGISRGKRAKISTELRSVN